jgi:hypothetical protein
LSQGAESAGVRPGVAVPTRVHDLLLDLAGRLDDDALADAREMLASAELDRALEFAAGCLVAGRVAVSGAQRGELATLFTQVHLDPALIERLVVDDAAASSALARHRFAGGSVDGEPATQGIVPAARRVLDMLPDVRSVWAVWRLTPAGPATGPVPHRVVLVGVGPAGFAPATAYRMENALRRAGIRASVEVLRDGAEAPEYHHAAMQYAAQVPFARQAPVAPQPSQNSSLSTAVTPVPSAPGPRPAPPPSSPPPSSPPLAKVAEITPPGRRSRPEAPADPLASANPPPRPPAPLPASWMTEPAPAAPHANGKALEPLPADDSLSEQEKALLRQLQEELARREQEETGHGRHGNAEVNPFDQPTSGRTPPVINGIPPQPDEQN